jgi:hypothetical protein
MKPAVRRIVVLTITGSAHLELRHRSPGTVIGNVLNNRVPRAAVCAIGERVTVAPIGWIQHFTPAIVACRYIGGDLDEFSRFAGAFHDLKTIFTPGLHVRHLHCFDTR